MSLLRNFATVGSATVTSRLLGFVRDILIAAALGTGTVADAFFVAFRLPNLFRRLFAEGAFASAFVPLYAKTVEAEGEERADRFAMDSLAALLLALAVLSLAAEIGMAALTFALAPGFADDAGKFELTVLLSRIAFPYLALVSVVSLLSGVLNGRGRFAAAAFSPALLNVVLIGALIVVYAVGLVGEIGAGIILSTGTAVGGLVQVVFLFAACRRAGVRLALVRPRLTPGVRRLTALAGPSVIAGGIVQINIVVGTIIASTEPSAVSWLYYADRVYQLPLAIVGIAIGVVLLPEIARRLSGGDTAGALATQNRAAEFALALTLPATIALVVVPGRIVEGLFERGAFAAVDTRETARVLAIFALGLPAFVLVKVLQPAFFARENTATPMWYSLATVIANIAVSLALYPFIGYIAVAVGTTVAGWLNVVLLAVRLLRDGAFVVDQRLGAAFLRTLAAVAALGLILVGAEMVLAPLFAAGGKPRIAALLILVAVGVLGYAVAALLFGAIRRDDLRRALSRGG